MYVGASVTLVRLRLCSGSTGGDKSVSQPFFRPLRGLDPLLLLPRACALG
jgi:hypothetical protein